MIIAVDDSERSQDAVAFGGQLARDSGAAVTVVHAYPWAHLGFKGNASATSGPTYEANRFLLQESEALLARMSDPLRDLADLETRSLADPSPGRALQALADGVRAGLIVMGSSHAGRWGRVLPGSTAERLLHGSPCPVAIVPSGYRSAERRGFKVIACGWDGSPESEAALAVAEALAERTSAILRVVRAYQPTYYSLPPALGVGYAELTRAGFEHAEQALKVRLTHLSAAVQSESDLHETPADRALVEVSEFVDLMILGSRGYGPLRAVLLGGVSGKVVREAGCPVIVVPNGAHADVAPLFGTGTQAAAR